MTTRHGDREFTNAHADTDDIADPTEWGPAGHQASPTSPTAIPPADVDPQAGVPLT